MSEVKEPRVEHVLLYLREARLFDFSGYKRATLSRRIERRMAQVGIVDYDEYIDWLQVHPEEFGELFNTILINVSSFFRDPEAWGVVRETVIRDLRARRSNGQIRVWSAGCATGQEAYSVAMLFAEEFGAEFVRDHVKVYATDLDSDALEYARAAEYSAREVEDVPPELLERYFQKNGASFAFTNELRRSVIFGRHDLLQDAPISRTDLLICRNTLMYFNVDMQTQLVNRLHFSLADHGFLFLGKVEMLIGHQELFQSIDPKHRVFRKVNRISLRTRLLAMAGRVTTPPSPQDERIIELSFELRTNPEILFDASGIVLAVNARARDLFGVGVDAIGRPFQDLELSCRPVELRSGIDQVRAEGRVVELDEVSRWTPSGDLTYLDIKLVPLMIDGRQLGVVITFSDVTRHRRLQQELEQTHRELEVANEELQSTIEELETTNEELQSTNEELETMNEELSSTNEELQAINDELRDRTAEVNEVNACIESVLAVIDGSIIVVDRSIQIRIWNGRSFEMWGLRAEEVEGKNLLGLDLGFPVDLLSPHIRSCLQGQEPDGPIIVDAVSRRGRPMCCVLRVAPLLGGDRSVEGAVIMISEDGAEA